MRRERGIALVAVLWFVVLLSLVALGMLSTSRGVNRQAQATVDRARAEALADGGVALAVTTLLEPAHRPTLKADGSERMLRLGADTLSISIQDEGGRIDLNAADPPILQGLFQSVGVAPDRARALTAAIVGRRDQDQAPERGGAEFDANRAAGRRNGHAAHRFYRVAELRQLPGMDRALFEKVAPALTVYSGSGRVDTGVAPPPVLAALRAAGVQVDTPAEQRSWGGTAFGGAQIASRNGTGRTRIRLPDSTTDTYSIRVDARLADGARFIRTAVILLTNEPDQPYLIYRWAAGDN